VQERRPSWARRIGLVALLAIIGSTPASAGQGGAAAMRRWIAIRFPDVQWISTEDLVDWSSKHEGDAPVLFDARAPAEFAVSHLAGARWIDPDAADANPAGLPLETPIVVYCSVGYRSAVVARKLAAAGYRRVYNLEGGIFQWANEGRAVFRGPERVVEVHPYDRIWGHLLDDRLHPQR